MQSLPSSQRHHTACYQSLPQTYSNQRNPVLPQKQTYKLMEQNRKPINNPMHVLATGLQQGTKIQKGESTVSSTMRKLDIHM